MAHSLQSAQTVPVAVVAAETVPPSGRTVDRGLALYLAGLDGHEGWASLRAPRPAPSTLLAACCELPHIKHRRLEQ